MELSQRTAPSRSILSDHAAVTIFTMARVIEQLELKRQSSRGTLPKRKYTRSHGQAHSCMVDAVLLGHSTGSRAKVLSEIHQTEGSLASSAAVTKGACFMHFLL
ncbi:hypothetical protein SKAU_G00145240 [Synaphobranchus kaupii]|uniref:Uncharacterized protein n=1 Tax=Synaphobranchus kaupii TaxID=118154 RepID=A0A9Q1FU49_SYNKA|nr:hypothetical protein SKAU_G00145240 [Synaphobranchus kaupii]